MVKSLIDRAVENDVKTVENPENNNEMSMDLKVENNTIYIQNLIDKSWYEFIKLNSILDTNLENFICEYEEENEIIISENITGELKKIKHNLKSAWDSDSKKFKLEYSRNKMGQIHKLYIPVKNKYMDNIVISEIYDEEGDFVGHELEGELNEDLYKIESSTWYVDKIGDDNTIYKKEDVGFRQILDKNHLIEGAIAYPITLLISITPYITYYLTGSISIGIATLIVLTLMWMLYPLCIFWTISYPIEFIYRAYVYYVYKENTIYTSLSD